jgi:hypothetical protein
VPVGVVGPVAEAVPVLVADSGMQEEEPAWGANVPGAQGVQLLAPAEAAKVLGRQRAQVVEFGEGAEEPGAQGVQAEAPAAE